MHQVVRPHRARPGERPRWARHWLDPTV